MARLSNWRTIGPCPPRLTLWAQRLLGAIETLYVAGDEHEAALAVLREALAELA
ncbi:hypothetical protein [Paludibacterium denitrificans]|uniref:hypothetical protein n=1 Tax=Paludibacterium denitrificans TaxID=2675226 RepID=UPI001E63B7FF|nr:hypothetical protein [Paludibacterium denitrificans]